MRTRFSYPLFALALSILLAGSAFAEDAAATPAKKWKNETEASLVSANGNTKATTYSAKNTFGYAWTNSSIELIGGALGSNSQDSVTAEKYFASEKYSYKLSDRNYAFEKIGWERDRFAGIRDRHDGTVGLGRELIKRERDLLIAELGGGYTVEDRLKSENVDFATGRVYSKYVHTISPTSSFSQDAEYLQNFENPDDFRVNTETAITAALSAHFSLKTSYQWQHVGSPPLGFARNDTMTTVALLAKY